MVVGVCPNYHINLPNILWVAASVIVLNVLVVVVVVVLEDKLHPFRMYSSLVFVHTYIHTFELSVSSFPFQEMSVYSNPEKHISEAIAVHNESLKESLNSIKITNADRFFKKKFHSFLNMYTYCMSVCMYVCMVIGRKLVRDRLEKDNSVLTWQKTKIGWKD